MSSAKPYTMDSLAYFEDGCSPYAERIRATVEAHGATKEMLATVHRKLGEEQKRGDRLDVRCLHKSELLEDAERRAKNGWARSEKADAKVKRLQTLLRLAAPTIWREARSCKPGVRSLQDLGRRIDAALGQSSEAGASAPKQRKGNTARTTEACNPSVDAGSRAPVTSTPSGVCRAGAAYAENARLRLILCRASVVLANMAREKPGALFGRRWAISAEPLRRDAANVLPDIEAALGLPLGAEAPRGDGHFVQGLKRWLDLEVSLGCATCRGSGKVMTGEMLLSMPPQPRMAPCPACTKTGGA